LDASWSVIYNIADVAVLWTQVRRTLCEIVVTPTRLALLACTAGMMGNILDRSIGNTLSARRRGHLLTEDLQDGFELDGVMFVNPFESVNDQLIDRILPS
jgi:predicted nucleic acid-binding protein